MLETMNQVNWAQLTHAYGSAEDVPQLLYNLVSDDQEIRNKTYWELYGNVFHQGTRWEVTPYVVPFLFELLDTESVQDKNKLIAYILALAVGYDEMWVPRGFSRTQYENAEKLNEYMRYEWETYQNCTKGIDLLIKYTNSDNESVALTAIQALAFIYDTKNTNSINQLLTIAQGEQSAKKYHAIIALGMLQNQLNTQIDLSFLSTILEQEKDQPTLLGLASAATLFLLNQNTEACIYLVKCLSVNWDMDKPFLFYEEDVIGYISSVLSTVQKDDVPMVLESLFNCLPHTNMIHHLHLAEHILILLNLWEKKIPPYTFKDLSSLSQRAVIEIGKTTDWKFLNLNSLMRSYGFPSNKEEFEKLLETH